MDDIGKGMPSVPAWKRSVRELVERLDSFAAETPYPSFGDRPSLSSPEVIQTISQALRLSLTALSDSLGECRVQAPYSPLRPVIDKDGNFHWCCNHTPEHCS